MKGRIQSIQVSWMAATLLPLLAGSAGAVNATSPQTNPSNQQQQPARPAQLRLDRARDLIDAKVVNDKCRQVATVADIVLTPDREAISYVALSRGWTWGIPQTYVAVPWSQFGLGTSDGKTVLVLSGVSKAQIDQAPGFTKNRWPAVASDNWLRMGPGFNVAPAGGAAVSVQQLRLSKLLGVTVRNLGGADLGELQNAMIDVRRGKPAFGVVEMSSGFLGLNKEYAPVPWSALDFTGRPLLAWLNTDKQTLTAMATKEDNFPNLENPQYSRQLYERFRATPYWGALGYVPGSPAEGGAGGSQTPGAGSMKNSEEPAEGAGTMQRSPAPGTPANTGAVRGE